MKKEVRYRCEICDKTFIAEQDCLNHEQECGKGFSLVKYEIDQEDSYSSTPKIITVWKYQFIVKVFGKQVIIENVNNKYCKKYKNESIIKYDEVQYGLSDLGAGKIYIYTKDLTQENEKNCIDKLLGYVKNDLINKKVEIENTLKKYMFSNYSNVIIKDRHEGF